MFSKFIVLIIACISWNVSALVELTSAEVTERVFNSREVWFMAHCIPSNCEALISTMLALEEDTNEFGINFGVYQCETDMKICQTLGNNILQLFLGKPAWNPYKKHYYRTGRPFTGKLEGPRVFRKFFIENFPNMIVGLNATSVIEEFQVSAKKGINAAVLVTEKSTIPPMFKTLAYNYHERIAFYSVHVSERDIMKTLSLHAPALFVFETKSTTAQSGSWHLLADLSSITSNEYSGDLRTFAEVSSYLDEFAIEAPVETPKTDGENTVNEQELPHQHIFPILDSHSLVSTVYSVPEAFVVVYDRAKNNTDRSWMKSLPKAQCDGLSKCAFVNCTDNNPLCDAIPEKVISTRVIRVFAYEEVDLPRHSEQSSWYEWDQLPEVIKMVHATIPGKVEVISQDQLQQALGSLAMPRNKIGIVAMTKKDTPSLLLTSLARALDSVAVTFMMPNPSPEFLESYKIPKVPSLSLFLAEKHLTREELQEGQQIKTMIVTYDPAGLGPLDFQNAGTFIWNVLERSRPDLQAILTESLRARSQNRRKETLQGDPDLKPMTSFYQLTDQSYMRVCNNQTTNQCLLVFLPVDDPIFQGTPTAGIPTWDILNEVQAEIIKAASKVNIGYVNALCAEDFANVFGVQLNSLPSAIMLHPKDRLYYSFVGSFTSQKLIEFVKKAIRGWKMPDSLDPLPEFNYSGDVTTCPAAMEVISQSQSEDGLEMDDLLAEIKEQEELKMKKIAEELEEEAKRQKDDGKKKGKKKKKKGKKSSAGEEL